MDIILFTLNRQFAIEYLNDMVLCSKTAEERINYVQQVFTLFHDAGVLLMLKRSNFFTNTIEYLCHVILPRRLEIARLINDAIGRHRPPTLTTELRSFYGLCKDFRRNLHNFARLAASLK